MARLGIGRTLLILALVLGTLVTPSAAKGPETGVLARVEVAGSLAAVRLPVYAGLQDAAGSDYALVIAPAAQLRASGLRFAVLDTGALEPGERYVIARTRRAGMGEQAAALVRVLHDDGRQLIARATAAQAEALSPLGYDYSWLPARPLSLRAVETPIATDSFVPDPIIAGMIADVTQSEVVDYGNTLSGETAAIVGGTPYTITTRNTNSGTPIDKATQYVYERLQESGLTVSYQDWSFSSGWCDGEANRNVIGELAGTMTPSEVVLIVAHLDDMPSSGSAPGADDNASGSVGVLMAADIMSQYSFARTVRFVLFTGEEQGLCGSEAYATYVHNLGQNVVAVYNMDMIAYDSTGGPTLRIHTRTTGNPGYAGDLAIAGVFTNVVSAYGLTSSLTPIISADGESASDHSSFWGEGYAAILAIEDDYNDFNDYYHSSQDTMAHCNFAYYTAYVKASVGTAAHLAVLAYPNRVYVPLAALNLTP